MAPINSLWFVPASVFLAGLLGSPHCASMCGPLVMNLMSYQLGRMTSYVAAGALSGALGRSVLGPTQPIWLSTVSLVLITLFLFFNGYWVFRGKSLHLPRWRPFDRFTHWLWKQLRISRLSPTSTAFATGGLTVLLPCGHLYSFLLGALATGSALQGSLFMFAFWLGSAPLLSAGALGINIWLRSKSLNRQRWAGAILIVAGLTSVASFAVRSDLFSHSRTQSTLLPPSRSCH